MSSDFQPGDAVLENTPDDGDDVVLFHCTADEVEDYTYTKTEPRSVFWLAMLAGLLCVIGVAAAESTMSALIDNGYMAHSPALQPLVERP